jgi:pyruvate/2-oxoglutarate dehydrogenase complex dihydrolipoamide acyltransferase (E2) component
MALVEVRVPDIGDFKDVAIIETLVKAGDTIRVEQSLITVESDKASMEIPSSHAGVVKELKVKLGDTVNIGDLVLLLETADVANVPVPVPVPAPAPAACACTTGCCTRCRAGTTAAPMPPPAGGVDDRGGARHRRLQGRGRH